MKRTRFVYIVSVLRDDVPGWNHQPEDMKNQIEKAVGEHYKPDVKYIATCSVEE